VTGNDDVGGGGGGGGGGTESKLSRYTNVRSTFNILL
jgi:hypothetical protein